MTEKRVHVGTIIAAHGVRGQLKIKSFTEHPETLLALGILTDAQGKQRFQFTRHGIQEDVLIVSDPTVTDRNGAELLRKTELYADADALPDMGENEFYHDDLTGLSILHADTKETLGTIKGVYNFGAGDILEITFSDGTEEMFPFVEWVFPEVNVKAGFITFIVPEQDE